MAARTIRTPPAQGSQRLFRRKDPRKTPVRGGIPQPAAIGRALVNWFRVNARDLPWRRRRTGYGALVSELMAQQTQMTRVVQAYLAFMRRFPTVRALAEATESAVLAAWQGLGYYRRARLLHAAAKVIVKEHGGRVPRDLEALRALPGVGPYTAGAIASIVFGQGVPIVDGNVLRVLCRLAGYPGQVGEARTTAWVWEQARQLVEASPDPGAFNEGLMELGATMCTPRAPRCESCPLARMCAARAQGNPGEYPRPKAAPHRQREHWHVLAMHGPRGVLLERRAGKGVWAGLWQPPTVEAAGAAPPGMLRAAWGTPVRRVARFTHVLSHREIIFSVYVPTAKGTCVPAPSCRWHRLGGLPQIPLANAAWRVLEAAGLPVSPPPLARGPRRGARAAPRADSGS